MSAAFVFAHRSQHYNAKVGIIIEKAQNYLVFYSLNRTFARKTRFWVYGQQERSVAEECRTTVEND
jgi:hypothetical protein